MTDTYTGPSRYKVAVDFSTLVFNQIERVNQAADANDNIRYYNNVIQLEKMLRMKSILDETYKGNMKGLESKIKDSKKKYVAKNKKVPSDVQETNLKNRSQDQFGFLMELIDRIGLLSTEQRQFRFTDDKDESQLDAIDED